MAVINQVKGGADLAHPKVSAGWMVGATVAVMLLMFVSGIAMFLYSKAKSVVSGGKAGAGGSDIASQANQLTAGWL